MFLSALCASIYRTFLAIQQTRSQKTPSVNYCCMFTGTCLHRCRLSCECCCILTTPCFFLGRWARTSEQATLRRFYLCISTGDTKEQSRTEASFVFRHVRYPVEFHFNKSCTEAKPSDRKITTHQRSARIAVADSRAARKIAVADSRSWWSCHFQPISFPHDWR